MAMKHPLTTESKHIWEGSFHNFTLNPKDKEAEDLYNLAKTNFQLCELLEAVWFQARINDRDTAFWIEKEMNLAYRTLKGTDPDFQFEKRNNHEYVGKPK